MSFEKLIQKKKKNTPKKAKITDLMDNKVKVVKGQFILMKSKLEGLSSCHRQFSFSWLIVQFSLYRTYRNLGSHRCLKPFIK